MHKHAIAFSTFYPTHRRRLNAIRLAAWLNADFCVPTHLLFLRFHTGAAYTHLANRTDGNGAKVDYFSSSKFKYFIKQTMNYSFDEMTNFRVAPGDRSMTLILLWES